MRAQVRRVSAPVLPTCLAARGLAARAPPRPRSGPSARPPGRNRTTARPGADVGAGPPASGARCCLLAGLLAMVCALRTPPPQTERVTILHTALHAISQSIMLGPSCSWQWPVAWVGVRGGYGEDGMSARDPLRRRAGALPPAHRLSASRFPRPRRAPVRCQSSEPRLLPSVGACPYPCRRGCSV